MRHPARKPLPPARGTSSTGPRRFVRRLRRRARAVKAKGIRIGRLRPGALSLGTARSSPWLRRAALAAALLGVAFMPYSSQAGSAVVAADSCHRACRAAQQVNMLRWSQPLPGSWDVLPGLSGTVPDDGLAYASAGDGVVALGDDMTVYAYSASDGKQLWQDPLSGFPVGAVIVSVRTWPGEVTVGVSYQGRRTEVVISDATGAQTGQYQAAPFGGAVAGSVTSTVIVARTSVISYDNANGHIRWQRQTGQVAQGWQTDGQYLYVAESAGGYLGSSPVTALRRIDMTTGAEQEILPAEVAGGVSLEGTEAFDGTLVAAFDDVVLFSAAAGVTAYSGITGARLWSQPGALAEGADPRQDRFYLTRASTLIAVRPKSGKITASAPSGGLYVVRDGVALGLDQGANGDAWGFYLAGQRVTMTAPSLGWPHYFVDLSGIGGSADSGSDLVVIAACAQTGSTSPAPSGSPDLGGPVGGSPPAESPASTPATTVSPTSSATAPPSAPVTQACLKPELVALSLLSSRRLGDKEQR